MALASRAGAPACVRAPRVRGGLVKAVATGVPGAPGRAPALAAQASAAVRPPCLPGRGAGLPAAPRRRRRCATPAAAAAAAAAAGSALAPEALPVWALLAASSAVATLAEQRTRWGAAISAPLIAIATGCGLAIAGVLPGPAGCAAYDAVWHWLMPVASALLVIETRDMSRRASGRAGGRAWRWRRRLEGPVPRL
jgi:hypothetical protein